MRFGFKLIGLRAKYRFAMMAFIMNELVFILLSIYISPLFFFAMIAVLFLIGIYVINLKCPVCGKPVLYNPTKIYGIDMYAYTVTIPPQCTQCGNPLS